VTEILFPSDLSPESDRAFEHARFLARWLGARITLFHAVEMPRHHPEGLWERAEEIQERAAAAARAHLEKLAGSVDGATRVAIDPTPSAHRALVAFTEREPIDLAVMATHGREGLAHLLLGSVTEKVVQHGRCSVLCIREPEHGVHIPYRRVLVPTDLSEASRRPFPLAERLARQFETEILTLHVAAEPPPPPKQRLVEALAGHFEGLAVHHRVETGRPWKRIVEAAERKRVDLIAMSTDGHHGLADALVGSTTERVVRHAPCPVLVTRLELPQPA